MKYEYYYETPTEYPLTVQKNRDFRPISRFVSETIQDRTAVTVERHNVRHLSNDALSDDLERPLTQISTYQKRYNIAL